MEKRDFITIRPEEEGERIDKILAARFSESGSRTYFQYLISERSILLNGQTVKKQTRPHMGDQVEICWILPPDTDLVPEPIQLDILFEDESIIAINKPPGMVVHPAPGNWKGTFVNALIHHCRAIQVLPGIRPGIVHRLDKETSGVLIAAKTLLAQQRLIEQFANRKIKKEYLAICLGNPGTKVVEIPIARHPIYRKTMTVSEERGKPATSHIETIRTNGILSYVKILPLTGRTHQIRVHLKHQGTPILGDAVYGNPTANKNHRASRQMLHAFRLEFIHPIKNELMQIEAPIPEDFQRFVDKI